MGREGQREGWERGELRLLTRVKVIRETQSKGEMEGRHGTEWERGELRGKFNNY